MEEQEKPWWDLDGDGRWMDTAGTVLGTVAYGAAGGALGSFMGPAGAEAVSSPAS